jgi:hypothetical protein
MRLLDFSFQLHYGPGVDLASKRNEYQECSWGDKGRPAGKADNFTAICDRLSKENVGASTSHNPISLHDRLQG